MFQPTFLTPLFIQQITPLRILKVFEPNEQTGMALNEVFLEVKTNFEKKHPNAVPLTWYQFYSYLWKYKLTGVTGLIQHAMCMKINPNILLFNIWTDNNQSLTLTSMNFLQKSLGLYDNYKRN